MDKIQVAILTTTPGGNKQLDIIRDLFDPNYFTVMFYGMDNFESTFYKALRNVPPETHCIVMRETSVTNANVDGVRDIIRETVKLQGWDICYLCRWLDRCDLYTNKNPVPGRGTNIVKTVSPHGTQALLFTPQGRDIILGRQPMKDGKFFDKNSMLGPTLHSEITKGNIDATCVVPNLFEFNILDGGPDDLVKTTDCAPPNPKRGGLPGWIYFVFIALIALLILFFIMRKR